MTEGDEKYKLGELTEGMSAVKSDISEIKQTQKDIMQQLISRNDVSVERWEKRNDYVDGVFSDHQTRIEALEEKNRIREKSIWTKILKAIEGNIVKLIAIGALGMIAAAAYSTLQQQNDSKYKSIDTLTETIRLKEGK